MQYALRLAAGFGSQISMALMRWVPTPDGAHRAPEQLGYQYRIADTGRWKAWLARVADMAEPDVEVVQHQLRVVEGHPALIPVAPLDEAAEVATAPEPAAASVNQTATGASPALAATPESATPPGPAEAGQAPVTAGAPTGLASD